MRLIIAITGASGSIYGIRLLEVLSEITDVETHLVISEAGELCIKQETEWRIEELQAMANFSYDIHDIGAPISSGSFKGNGMVVVPCSMKTLSALANSYAANLISRCGDVTLKERRRLVLLVRETPLHLGHLRNMVKLTEMGAIIMPPIPTFYYKPQTIQEIVDHTIGRVLDLFQIEYSLFPRWQGLSSTEESILR